MGFVYGLTDLSGVPIGRLHWATERKLTLPLNGLPTASFTLRLDDPLATEILSRKGDCLLKVYEDSTLVFIGDIMDVEEVGAGGFYKRIIDRKGTVNIAYVLPQGFEAGTTGVGEIAAASDTTSIAARGQFEEVIPSDVQDSQLRQALASGHVYVRKQPREIITFDPSAKDVEGTVAVNAAGPMWRLSKRLLGTPYPSAGRSWTGSANSIIDAWLNQTNTNSDSGIRLGTRDALYNTTIGDESSYAFKPVSEALTDLQESKVAYPIDTPPAYVAHDSFTVAGGGTPGTDPNHTSGALAGQKDALGNTWSGAGDADDFAFQVSGINLYRGATGDTTFGRFALSGVANQTSVVVGVDWSANQSGGYGALSAGVVARYADTSNFVNAFANLQANQVGITKYVAGTPTVLGTYSFPSGGFVANENYRIRLLIDEYGNWTVWHYGGAAIEAPKLYGQDSDLATGGPLETGRVGIYDAYPGSSALDRVYDEFMAAQYTGVQSFDFEIAPVEPTADASGYPGTLPYIGVLNVRSAIGASKPEVIFEPGKTPEFGTNYTVGDYVTGRARKDSDEARFNALFRVNGVDVSIDDEGRATVIPELTNG